MSSCMYVRMYIQIYVNIHWCHELGHRCAYCESYPGISICVCVYTYTCVYMLFYEIAHRIDDGEFCPGIYIRVYAVIIYICIHISVSQAVIIYICIHILVSQT